MHGPHLTLVSCYTNILYKKKKKKHGHMLAKVLIQNHELWLVVMFL